ncbi:CobW family GTP-binding protein [Segnochrobactrum spirostomi]|uniref:GTP-binding protein n=1 Tax=Segnochrobactrum spirostomi TaxID=2608987 RepID=A0A6A7Y6B4_9HYPH|nr:CobW family GTP-binding protein [Segnochrobactrum spirostomi]MQT14784.1 GTP-binding protein [Segnochrobactrum spirostomi]
MLAFEKPDDRTDHGRTAPADPPRVPITIVTGYLGSGKTTLISALLQAPEMAGTAVIVNELADVGIDQSVIADAGASGVVLLSNGCLCCARGTDLANAVRQLLAFGPAGGRPIERVLIETSGAADPGPLVRQVCFDPHLRSRLRYGGVLCLFDAAFGPDHLDRDPVGYRQLALADMVLVTKTDLVDPEATAAVIARLRALNAVPLVTTEPSDAGDFLSGRSREAGRAGSPTWLGTGAEAAEVTHAAEIGSWSIRASAPIDWPIAEQAMRTLFDRHGDHILRTKGIIHTRDDARPLVIHGIGRHFHRPLRLRGWDGAAGEGGEGRAPATRLVVIGFPPSQQAAEEIAAVLGGVATKDAPLARF